MTNNNPFKAIAGILYLLLLFCFGCNSGQPKLTEFNAEVWKNDANACKDQRRVFEKVFNNQKSEIIGLNEHEILALLGRPDRQDLRSRNQKFYLYFLAPGPSCGKRNEPAILNIRFSALNQVTEVLVQKGNAVTLPKTGLE